MGVREGRFDYKNTRNLKSVQMTGRSKILISDWLSENSSQRSLPECACLPFRYSVLGYSLKLSNLNEYGKAGKTVFWLGASEATIYEYDKVGKTVFLTWRLRNSKEKIVI